MAHAEVIHDSIKQLVKETNSSKELRDAIETLITINRNALPDDAPDKFRKIRIGNQRFHQTIWRFRSARNILVTSGWVEQEYTVEDGATIRLVDKERLKDVLEVLVANRDISPNEDEWDERTKVVETGRKTKEQIRDIEQRRQGLEDAKRAREQFLRDKEYREQLANHMRLEQEAERKAREARVPKTDQQIKEAEYAKKGYSPTDPDHSQSLPIDSTEHSHRNTQQRSPELDEESSDEGSFDDAQSNHELTDED